MAFPTASVLDSFTRADAGSLGANWGNGIFGGLGFTGFDVVSNAASNGDHAHWSAESFAADQEAFFTIQTMSGTLVALHLRGQSAGTSGGAAYEVVWRDDNTVDVTRVIDSYTTETSLGSTDIGVAPASGSKFGARVTGSGATVTIDVYVDTGSGWGASPAATFTDSGATRITAGGNIGMVAVSTSAVYDDFGGGNVVVTASPLVGGGATAGHRRNRLAA
jgi:hypothetical protein